MRGYTGVIHKISIIVPVYCEADNLSSLVGRIMDSLAASHLKDNEIEIIVVDDNSPDGTREVCQLLASQCPAIKLIIRFDERGLGTAVKRGIDESSGDILVVMDADLSHDPAVVPLLVNEILNNSTDVAVASRFIDRGQMHSSPFCTLGSKALNTFIRVLLQLPVKDVTGGFLALRKDMLKGLDMDSICRGHGDYSFALLYSGVRQGWKIKEVGFNYQARKNGVSKTKFLGAGFSYGIRALKLRMGLE